MFNILFPLNKSKGYPPGTIRTWNGIKYKKTGEKKWIPVPKGTQGAAPEDETKQTGGKEAPPEKGVPQPKKEIAPLPVPKATEERRGGGVRGGSGMMTSKKGEKVSIPENAKSFTVKRFPYREFLIFKQSKKISTYKHGEGSSESTDTTYYIVDKKTGREVADGWDVSSAKGRLNHYLKGIKSSSEIDKVLSSKNGKGTEIPEELVEKVKRAEKGKGAEIKLTAEEVPVLLQHGTFGLISAGRNMKHDLDSKLSEKEVEERTQKLHDDLIEGGYKFVKVHGKYGEEEDSYMVMIHDVDRESMTKFGERYNQDSVIYAEKGKNEMIFTTGENKGKRHEGSGYEPVEDSATDYYSEIEIGGKPLRFRLKFDFETMKSLLNLRGIKMNGLLPGIFSLLKGKKMPIGTITHRKGGDYKKLGEEKWRPVPKGEGAASGKASTYKGVEIKKDRVGYFALDWTERAVDLKTAKKWIDAHLNESRAKAGASAGSKGIKEITHKGIPAKGSEVHLGKKHKESVWTDSLRAGKKMVVIGHDTLDGKPMLVLASPDDMKKPDFDPEMDYSLVYPDELRSGGDVGEKKEGGTVEAPEGGYKATDPIDEPKASKLREETEKWLKEGETLPKGATRDWKGTKYVKVNKRVWHPVSEKSLQDEDEAILKSLNREDDVLWLNTGKACPAGTVRNWKGREYTKVSDREWKPASNI